MPQVGVNTHQPFQESARASPWPGIAESDPNSWYAYVNAFDKLHMERVQIPTEA